MNTLKFDFEKFVRFYREADGMLTYAFGWDDRHNYSNHGKSSLINTLKYQEDSPGAWLQKGEKPCDRAVSDLTMRLVALSELEEFGPCDKDRGFHRLTENYDDGLKIKVTENPTLLKPNKFNASALLFHSIITAYDVVTKICGQIRNEWFSTYQKSKWDIDEGAAIEWIEKIKRREKQFETSGFGSIFTMNDRRVASSEADFLYAILDIDGRKTAAALKAYLHDKNNGIRAQKEHLRALKDVYLELKKKAKGNQAERVLYLYRLESIFGVELVDIIFSNIVTLRKEDYKIRKNESDFRFCYVPDGSGDVKMLAHFGEMQNTFSRGYFLQFLMDYLFDSAPTQTSGLGEWLSKSSKVCAKYSRIVIPALQWAFLRMLFKEYGVTEAMLDKKNSKELEEKCRTIKADLEEYIIKNADVIETPELELQQHNAKCGELHKGEFLEKDIDSLSSNDIQLIGLILQNFYEQEVKTITDNNKDYDVRQNFSMPELSRTSTCTDWYGTTVPGPTIWTYIETMEQITR